MFEGWRWRLSKGVTKNCDSEIRVILTVWPLATASAVLLAGGRGVARAALHVSDFTHAGRRNGSDDGGGVADQ